MIRALCCVFLIFSVLFPTAAAELRTLLDFEKTFFDKKGHPSYWFYQGKIGTPDLTFRLIREESGKRFLEIHSVKGTGKLRLNLKENGVDLDRTPVMRWVWRAEKLPAATQGKDLQGLAIQIGSGLFRHIGVAYFWQSGKSRGESGKKESFFNTVDWFCLRDAKDDTGIWLEEKRDVKADLLQILRTEELPDDLILTISMDSADSATEAVMSLMYIEFTNK